MGLSLRGAVANWDSVIVSPGKYQQSHKERHGHKR
jgi:hypothetical protein